MTVSPMDTISTDHQIGMYETAQHAVRYVYRCNVPIADCTGPSDQHRKLCLRIPTVHHNHTVLYTGL